MCQGETIAGAEGAEMFVEVQGAQILFCKCLLLGWLGGHR